MDKSALRDAATVIVLRDRHTAPAVLMGQRGKSAAFMPGKFVFPGGAVDAVDATVPVDGIQPTVHAALSENSTTDPNKLIAAAIRELWEETGQVLGDKGNWPNAPQGWRGFAETGHVPNGAACQFFFRAVTPEGRPRRFDARFILADANELMTDPDDFSRADDELAHLQWVPLQKAREFDLPFITKVVLAELVAHIRDGGPITDIPFFQNDDERHLVSRLAGKPLL